MTTTELADAAEVNISTIQRIEAGKGVRMSTIRSLVKALNCNPEDILWPKHEREQDID